MRIILKNIALLVMLSAFLVSATGFRLVKHTCPACHIVEYTLHEPKPCCGSETQAENIEPIACCSVAVDHVTCSLAFASESCCEIESSFYVIDEVVSTPTQKVEIIIFQFPGQAGESSIEIEVSNFEEFLFAYQHPPPSSLTGTSYLVFLQQLKIPTC